MWEMHWTVQVVEEGVWKEVCLNDTEWVDVGTTVTTFNAEGDKNVSVFWNLSHVGGPTYNDGFPLASKIQQWAAKQFDGILQS